ncbi:MAG TPA: type II 3-dehydroquinate dehydratase [Acidimicrobiia bacterium]|nr:type II 3-dehydroquinate dehydratase [Acidimicrobiia bacterium]
MRVLVINGPNLNLLGVRRPEVYGTTTLAELEESCRAWGAALGLEVDTFQSNHEGGIIDRLHDALGSADGVVLNPGALTHYSYALHDAIEAVALPVVEVHLSDTARREEWRARSVVSPACVATIRGHGVEGYREALEFLAERAGASSRGERE